MTNRRDFLTACAAGATLGGFSPLAHAQAEGWGKFEEVHQGGPSMAPEKILVDPAQVATLSSGEVRASFRARDADFLAGLISTAGKHVGNSRASSPDRIVEYLDVFDLPFKANNEPTPFCAAGVVYAAATHYAKKYNVPATNAGYRSVLAEIDRYHFYPSPSVWDMVNVAKGKRKWKSFNAQIVPKPGWLVVFDWKKRGNADHVGIVEKRDGAVLQTIEFNTSDDNPSNGGRVAKKKRVFDSTILGFIATDLRPPFES